MYEPKNGAHITSTWTRACFPSHTAPNNSTATFLLLLLPPCSILRTPLPPPCILRTPGVLSYGERRRFHLGRPPEEDPPFVRLRRPLDLPQLHRHCLQQVYPGPQNVQLAFPHFPNPHPHGLLLLHRLLPHPHPQGCGARLNVSSALHLLRRPHRRSLLP